MAEVRKQIPAATAAALWALSNGNCYAPGCPFPVIYEVRPKVYRKNAQIAHIHGVQRGTPRYKPMSTDERDSFSNLLLLCLAHHGEVDDKKTGEELYPADLLRGWKNQHEGESSNALSVIRIAGEELLFQHLTRAFEPPLQRLEKIADHLAKTGTLTASSVADLQQVVKVLQADPVGISPQSARGLAFAAEVLGTHDFAQSASRLAHAADVLPGVASRLESAARGISGEW